MSKKKKKKGLLHDRFYQIYFGVVALVLILMCVGRVWLNGVLVDYEAAQPVYVAEKVADLFETGDYETIYKMDTSALDIAGGDEAFYLESMQALSQGKAVGWDEAFSPDDDARNYNVTLDGDRFATFTLVHSGETTKHGNALWKLGSVSTLVKVEATPEPDEAVDASEPNDEPDAEATPEPAAGPEIRVKAPNGFGVTVDGVKLDESNATVASKPLIADGFLPSGVASLTYTEYTYTAGSEAPVVEVTDASGAAQTVNQINATTWDCPVAGDATFQQNYGNAAFALGKRIALITARDASVDSMKKYCASGSPAWNIFDNLSNRWATPHSGSSFQNVVVDQFYLHSDQCFTCHVTFDFILNTSSGAQTYPTAYTFCVIQQGGKAKLYNLMMQ